MHDQIGVTDERLDVEGEAIPGEREHHLCDGGGAAVSDEQQ
jgi:hypothetical protein